MKKVDDKNLNFAAGTSPQIIKGFISALKPGSVALQCLFGKPKRDYECPNCGRKWKSELTENAQRCPGCNLWGKFSPKK